MTTNSDHLHRREFAAQAVARLYSGTLSAAEQADIEKWLARDPANRAAFEATLTVWDKVGALSTDTEIAAAALVDGSGSNHATIKSWSRRRVTIYSGIAATLVASVIAALLLQSSDTAMKETYRTAVGGQLDIELIDGSRLTLNTDTELTVDFDRLHRHVQMKRGEAFFDVHRDPDRPLTVDVGDKAVRVLGTKFNVRWTGANVTVAVLDGTVAVGQGGAPLVEEGIDGGRRSTNVEGLDVNVDDDVLLESGTIGTFSPDAVPQIEKAQFAVVEIPSWRFGLIRFEEAPLYQVVAEINRYSKTKIVIEDKAVMDLKLTGLFRPTDIDAVLKGLQETLPIKVIREFQRFVIVGDSQEASA